MLLGIEARMLKRTSIFLILALLAVIIGACVDDTATQLQRAIEQSQAHLVPYPTPALLGALPPGTYPIGGPIIDISGGLLPADTTLRDAGVLAINDGAWWKVNSKTGNGWQPAASSDG